MKQIDIVYTTWIRSMDRLEYFMTSVESVQPNLKHAEYQLNWHVAVEAEQEIMHKEKFYDFCDKNNLSVYPKKTPPSLSSMLNFANGIGEAPLMILMQDDWEMVLPLNIDKYARWLEENEKDYVVRLIWRDDFLTRTASINEYLSWINPEVRGFVFCDTPHLRKREYIDILGAWPDSMIEDENGKMFDNARCENVQNARAREVADDHRVLTVKKKHFVHIGHNTTLTDKVFNR